LSSNIVHSAVRRGSSFLSQFFAALTCRCNMLCCV